MTPSRKHLQRPRKSGRCCVPPNGNSDYDGHADRLPGRRATTMFRRVVLAVGMAMLVGGGVAVSQTAWFSDVPPGHPQTADIQTARDRGWFQGYDDGTFRPNQIIPDRQLTKVLRRAFPEGRTRADLATFMRGGEQALGGEIVTAISPSPTTTIAPPTPTSRFRNGTGDEIFWVRGLAAGLWWAELSFVAEGFSDVDLYTERPDDWRESLTLSGGRDSNPDTGTLDTSGGDYLFRVSGAGDDIRWEFSLTYVTE